MVDDYKMEKQESSQQEMIKAFVDEHLASSIVRELYGFRVRKVKELNGYDDRNFHVELDNGCENSYVNDICSSGYTLKVINKTDSQDTGFIDAMDCVLFNCHQKGLHVPVPVRNKSGNLWSLKLIPDKSNNLNAHVVRLLTYLPGITVCQVPYTPSILFQWGKLLAQFHISLKDFSHNAIKERKILWSLLCVPKILEVLPCIDNKERRCLVNDVVKLFKKDVLDCLEDLPTGIIHGDFNEQNILVRKIEEDYEVYGILDFGDLHVAPVIFDVSNMLTYTMLDCKTMDTNEACGHALAGYVSVLPISDRERKILRICILARLCQSLVLGAYTYSLDPSNKYALTSARTGWNVLQKLWNTTEQQLHDTWQSITEKYN